MAALVGPEQARAGIIGAINHRTVDERGDFIGMLARIRPAGAGSRIKLGPIKWDDRRAGTFSGNRVRRIKLRIASRHGNVQGLELRTGAVRSQVDIVVDEL